MAGRDVGGDERLSPEPLPVLLQRKHKALELLRRALDLDADALRVVADRPREPVPARQGVDERPEANPLHDATHGDPAAHAGRRFHGARHRWHAMVSMRRLLNDTLAYVRSSYSLVATYCVSSCIGGYWATARPRWPRLPVILRGTRVSSRFHPLFRGEPSGFAGSFMCADLRNE